MALIKCPDCGKDVSDQATACPNCGFPIERQNDLNETKTLYKKKSFKERYLGFIVWMSIFSFIILFFYSINHKQTKTIAPSASTNKPAPTNENQKIQKESVDVLQLSTGKIYVGQLFDDVIKIIPGSKMTNLKIEVDQQLPKSQVVTKSVYFDNKSIEIVVARENDPGPFKLRKITVDSVINNNTNKAATQTPPSQQPQTQQSKPKEYLTTPQQSVPSRPIDDNFIKEKDFALFQIIINKAGLVCYTCAGGHYIGLKEYGREFRVYCNGNSLVYKVIVADDGKSYVKPWKE